MPVQLAPTTDFYPGLTSAEARQCLAVNGPNALETVRPEPWHTLLFRQFKSLIVGVLAGAAAVSFALGDSVEGWAILVVLAINTLIGFVLEWKARQSMQALRRLDTALARVVRDGQVQEISSEDVTPGDLLPVAAAPDVDKQQVDLYVFCANTYNFRPVWAISDFIRKQQSLDGQSVVAITLGSGSTDASQKALEKLIVDKKANLLDLRSLWLLKPNDESRMRESNVAVSVSMAYVWGEEIAKHQLSGFGPITTHISAMNRQKFLGIAGGTIVLAGGTYYGFSDRSNYKRADSEQLGYSNAQLTTDERQILFLASLAPSGHNTQPWFIKHLEPNHWIVGCDKTRWLPGVGPTQRETMLSSGAFLQTIEYAASSLGYTGQFDTMATTNQNVDIVAVKLTKSGHAPAYDTKKIISRRTVRSKYLNNP